MENKELKAKDIPMGYALCFNDACNRKDTCMHYQANMLTNQQADIMKIMSHFGTTDGIHFDHYETDWDFG